VDKDQVAAVMTEIGTLLELKGENPFKTRAYHNAARTLEGLTEPLSTLVAEKRLGELKGIGEALQEKITILVTTGHLPYHEELKASLPPGLLELLELQGVGPKKVKKMYDELGVNSIESLEAACKDGRVAALAGERQAREAHALSMYTGGLWVRNEARAATGPSSAPSFSIFCWRPGRPSGAAAAAAARRLAAATLLGTFPSTPLSIPTKKLNTSESIAIAKMLRNNWLKKTSIPTRKWIFQSSTWTVPPAQRAKRTGR
jgi:hypothetical protein